MQFETERLPDRWTWWRIAWRRSCRRRTRAPPRSSRRRSGSPLAHGSRSTFPVTAITGAIALVWVAEAVNTAIEALADVVTSERHPGIARAKDVAAGAVLLAAIASLVVAALVFVPRLR